MRKTMWMVWGLAVCVMMGSTTVSAADQDSTWTRVEEFARLYTTPEAVAKVFQEQFTYEEDSALFAEEECWQSPEEFLHLKKGDCEDYALLAQAALSRNGVEAYVFSLFGAQGYVHTVCLFVDQRGGYSILNVDRIIYYHADSLEALASAMQSDWTFGGITERYGRRGRLVKEITHVETDTQEGSHRSMLAKIALLPVSLLTAEFSR